MIATMNKPSVPTGFYVCPNCQSSINVHIPLLEPPVHRCSALSDDASDEAKSKKTYVMERRGGVNEGRRSLGRLVSPDTNGD